MSNFRFPNVLNFSMSVFFIARLEDVTDPEAIRKDRKCDRNVCLYGYVRGTHLKKNTNIHIPGNALQYLDHINKRHTIV